MSSLPSHRQMTQGQQQQHQQQQQQQQVYSYSFYSKTGLIIATGLSTHDGAELRVRHDVTILRYGSE